MVELPCRAVQKTEVNKEVGKHKQNQALHS